MGGGVWFSNGKVGFYKDVARKPRALARGGVIVILPIVGTDQL